MNAEIKLLCAKLYVWNKGDMKSASIRRHEIATAKTYQRSFLKESQALHVIGFNELRR